MTRYDAILAITYIAVAGALVYWCYRDVQRKPRELTPDEIREELYRQLEQREWARQDGYEY